MVSKKPLSKSRKAPTKKGKTSKKETKTAAVQEEPVKFMPWPMPLGPPWKVIPQALRKGNIGEMKKIADGCRPFLDDFNAAMKQLEDRIKTKR